MYEQFAVATSEATVSLQPIKGPKNPEKKKKEKCDDDHMKAARNINIYLMISLDIHIDGSICRRCVFSIHNSVGGEKFIVVYIVNLYFFTTCFHYFSSE